MQTLFTRPSQGGTQCLAGTGSKSIQYQNVDKLMHNGPH